MKYFIKFSLSFLLLINYALPQTQHTIMSYNLLNYPGSDTTTRNPYFRTILSATQPDILVVQEMISQAGVNGFRNNVLLPINSNYTAGIFIDGPDTDNAIFFKNNIFTFISNTAVETELRDISEFKLVHNLTSDTIRIYSVHLKASQGSSEEQQRLQEVTLLRNYSDNLPAGSNFIILGDFNIYSTNEPAYQKLLNQSASGYFIDPFSLTGIWNNSTYAQYHTQSPRTRSFGGGANGGMDDRFDMILMSQPVIDSGGITFIPGSYIAYGNDGNHYNDSINRPTNTAVGKQIANALHYASDHIPVIASFSFDFSFIELTSFIALIEGLYNGDTMVPDTITIELHNSYFPYTLVDQAKIFLNSSGQGSGKFYSATKGTPYYLVLKHRNGLETWSGQPLTFTVSKLAYDFTSASNKAYGNNLKLVGSRWCIYSGDVNQDGFINYEDLNLVFEDNLNGVQGNSLTDLNGDMFTEIDDLNMVFKNKVLGIVSKRPPEINLKESK